MDRCRQLSPVSCLSVFSPTTFPLLRSSSRTCDFPASGFRSRIMPSLTACSAATVVRDHVSSTNFRRGIACVSSSSPHVPTRALSQPFRRMTIYGFIVRTELTQIEIIRPAGQHLVETPHLYHLTLPDSFELGS